MFPTRARPCCECPRQSSLPCFLHSALLSRQLQLQAKTLDGPHQAPSSLVVPPKDLLWLVQTQVLPAQPARQL